MIVPHHPAALTDIGFTWRRIEPSDERLVIDSWRTAAFKPFVLMPPYVLNTDDDKRQMIIRNHRGLFPHLNQTVFEAQMNNNSALLRRIFDTEMPKLMNRYLAPRHIIVVFDIETNLLIGWGCEAYRFVKLAYRGNGIGRALREAIEGQVQAGRHQVGSN